MNDPSLSNVIDYDLEPTFLALEHCDHAMQGLGIWIVTRLTQAIGNSHKLNR